MAGESRGSRRARPLRRRRLGRVAAEVGSPDAEHRVEFGAAAGRILAVSETEGASLVVLGTRGRGRMKAAMLGSVSREVAAPRSLPGPRRPGRLRR
ncbi:MAG: universal stress protein [Gaiellaceae bacterium]